MHGDNLKIKRENKTKNKKKGKEPLTPNKQLKNLGGKLEIVR